VSLRRSIMVQAPLLPAKRNGRCERDGNAFLRPLRSDQPCPSIRSAGLERFDVVSQRVNDRAQEMRRVHPSSALPALRDAVQHRFLRRAQSARGQRLIIDLRHPTHRSAHRRPVAVPGWRDEWRGRLRRCCSGGFLVASRFCGRRSDGNARTSTGLLMPCFLIMAAIRPSC